MCSCEPSAAPSPAGTNTSVWLLVSLQLPGVLGRDTRAAEPSTAETGLENVRWMCVAGEMCVPAAGRLPSPAQFDGGNQLTCVGAPTVSQGRAATAISVVPVSGWAPSEIVCWAVPSVWTVVCPLP